MMFWTVTEEFPEREIELLELDLEEEVMELFLNASTSVVGRFFLDEANASPKTPMIANVTKTTIATIFFACAIGHLPFIIFLIYFLFLWFPTEQNSIGLKAVL